MTRQRFETWTGASVPAVTSEEMREIDRVAVEEVGLGLLQMMENAGRNLAAHARELREGDGSGAREESDPVVILAGGGGNGGGGLCAARHLANRDVPLLVVLDRDPDELTGAAATQFATLRAMDVEVADPAEGNEVADPEEGGEVADGAERGEVADVADAIETAGVVVDAVIGYSLQGAVHGRAKDLVETSADADAPVLSLDVPSGYDATTGETPGAAVAPDRTLTLALPKTGLDAPPGDLYLGDIAIPAAVYERVGVEYESPFGGEYWVELSG